MNTLKQVLPLDDIANDTLVVIGAGTYNATAQAIAAIDPQYWIENWLGKNYFCTCPTDAGALNFTGISNGTPFSRSAIPFHLIELQPLGGGHPVYVPKPPIK